MKNIEKYPETRAALEAYNGLGFKKVPFNEWLEREYELTHPFTTSEAAQAVVDEWYATGPDVNDDHFNLKIIALENAVEREKAKPVRNFDKYKTADEAYDGFKKMCNDMETCAFCRFRDGDSIIKCGFAWLYENAEKEAK